MVWFVEPEIASIGYLDPLGTVFGGSKKLVVGLYGMHIFQWGKNLRPEFGEFPCMDVWSSGPSFSCCCPSVDIRGLHLATFED